MANDIGKQAEDGKVKVLDLQDLELVNGAAAQVGEEAWSVGSHHCVDDDSWSTLSEGCE
ncbi:MAG: hypothetical protein K2X55_10585 [Burkholderiaceae bacterium]|nr:hypothetical protein [Burkholderiaceae bacterium]